MSFEVVTQSRIEQRRTTGWRLVVNAGLEMGCTGIALAMVGILSMFNERSIIVAAIAPTTAPPAMFWTWVANGRLDPTRSPATKKSRPSVA